MITINAIKSSANCPVPAGTTQKVNVTSIEDLKKQFPEQFDRIGSFEGKASLFLTRDARPSIDAPRKCGIHLKARLQQELDTMENDGIIRKIEHHTDWCSSITTSVKKDGSLRVCLDPKRLNDNLKRCPHKIPTLEELNHEFAEARVFSKMDAKAGYWSIHLDEASQEITTFRTPFGRYCYRRLPFGLCVSQDLFQQAMDRILARAPGCVGIADDVVVYGRDNTEHEKNLLQLMQVAKEEGLVFNSINVSSRPARSYSSGLCMARMALRHPKQYRRYRGARWPSGLERWLVQATGLSWPGSNPTAENFASELWQFRLPRFTSVFRRSH